MHVGRTKPSAHPCSCPTFSPGQMSTCESKSQTKTSLNFKARYHVKYTFNAPIGIIVIAEHQFAMFGAMYCMCLCVVTWQRSNSCSHWNLISSVLFFLSVQSWAAKQLSRKVEKGFKSCDPLDKPATMLHNIPKCTWAYVHMHVCPCFGQYVNECVWDYC